MRAFDAGERVGHVGPLDLDQGDDRVLGGGTGHPVGVMLDLECLAIETGTPSGGGPLTIVNTGTVATDTPDTNPADDSSTVSITVQPAAPVVTPEPMRFTLGTTARFTRTAAAVSVPATCAGARACAGTLKVSADVPATKRSGRRTVTLGSAAYRIAPHSSAKVAVHVPARYRSLLRSGRVKSVTVRTAAKTVHRKLVVR